MLYVNSPVHFLLMCQAQNLAVNPHHLYGLLSTNFMKRPIPTDKKQQQQSVNILEFAKIANLQYRCMISL